MKKFQIFKPGRHTSNSGVALEFTEAQLLDSIAAYDPAIHEAPITVGHPKDNLPAYGWIGALSYSDGAVEAEPVKLEETFVELVKAGRFTKRSASWYLPDAAANPTPGKLYLRHVAFLGAQPPAVKGLRELEFNDDETGTIEFSDSFPQSATIADLFRNVREWIIGKHGVETADSVIPNYSVTALETAASKPDADALPAFSENKEDDEMTITKEQLDAAVKEATDAAQAQIDAVKADAKAALEKRDADFAEQGKVVQATLDQLAANERALKRKEITKDVEALAKGGKILPANIDSLVSFVEGLPVDESIEFGEGDAKKKVSKRDYLFDLLNSAPAPTVVEYDELSEASEFAEGGKISAADVAKKAQEYQDKERAAGRSVTITQAVYEVSKTRRVA